MKAFGSRKSMGDRKHWKPPRWPFGRNGPLFVSGSTTFITAGQTRDYSMVFLRNSGFIRISSGIGWTVIGCAGTWFSDSTSKFFNVAQVDKSGTITKKAPNGASLSHTFSHNSGGFGGYDEDFENDPGGDDGNGHGGGGSTDLAGGYSTDTDSGYGADGTLAEFFGSEAFGGASASGSGANGENGTAFEPSITYTGDGRGGAGSGGCLGATGGPTYICIRGSIFIARADGIDLQGGSGGTGGFGNDTNGNFTGNAYIGGGGGGGSGGNGGQAVMDLERPQVAAFGTNKVITAGGASGDGGNGGAGFADGGDTGTDGTKTIRGYNF